LVSILTDDKIDLNTKKSRPRETINCCFSILWIDSTT